MQPPGLGSSTSGRRYDTEAPPPSLGPPQLLPSPRDDDDDDDDDDPDGASSFLLNHQPFRTPLLVRASIFTSGLLFIAGEW